MVKRLIIHGGAGKCGSSALQTWLPRAGLMRSDEIGVGRYAVVRRNGLVLGESLRRRAEDSLSGAKSSPIFSNLGTFGESFPTLLRRRLGQYYEDHDFLVVSNESYFHTSESAHLLLDCVPDDVQVEFIAWVRSPVDLVNSAWWQWGAWSSSTLSEYIGKFLDTQMRWGEFAEQYAGLVDRVDVVPLRGDIVGDFCDIYSIGQRVEQIDRANASLPGEVLRLYQRHPDLRPEPHRPRFDFILSRSLPGGKPPWVVPMDEVERIIEFMGEQAPLMEKHVRSVYMDRISSDPRWSDPEEFRSKPVEDWRPQEAGDGELDELCYQLVKALDETYRERGL